MENVNHSPKFWSMFGRMFRLFFGNLQLFLPVLVVYGVLLVAASYGWVAFAAASADTAGVGLSFWFLMIAFIVVMAVVGVSYSLSLMKCALSVVKGEEIGPMEAVSFGFKNFWGGLKATFRAGWYVAWPVVIVFVVLAVFAVVTMIRGMAGGGSDILPSDFGGLNVFEAVGAAGFLDPSDNPSSISDATGGSMIDFGGEVDAMPELYGDMGTTISNSGLTDLVFKFVNSGLALVGLLAVLLMFVFFIIRGPKAAFTLYEYVDSPRSGGDCLRASIELVKGNFWKVLGFIFFVNIILAILFIAPLDFVYDLMGLERTDGVVNGIDNLFSLVMGALGVLFMAQFYLGLKNK